jgi:hypothetical protein
VTTRVTVHTELVVAIVGATLTLDPVELTGRSTIRSRSTRSTRSVVS